MASCSGAAQGCRAGDSLEVGTDRVGGASSTTAEAQAIGALGHGYSSREAEYLYLGGVGSEDIEAGRDAIEADAIACGAKKTVAEF